MQRDKETIWRRNNSSILLLSNERIKGYDRILCLSEEVSYRMRQIYIKEKLEEAKLYLEVQKLTRLIQKGCIEHLHCFISIVLAFKLADQPI